MTQVIWVISCFSFPDENSQVLLLPCLIELKPVLQSNHTAANKILKIFYPLAFVITNCLVKQRKECFQMVDKDGHVFLRKKTGNTYPGREQAFPFRLKWKMTGKNGYHECETRRPEASGTGKDAASVYSSVCSPTRNSQGCGIFFLPDHSTCGSPTTVYISCGERTIHKINCNRHAILKSLWFRKDVLLVRADFITT